VFGEAAFERGAGSIAAAKLAAMCIGGITIVGGSVY
jgi:hypothetical protein